MTPMTPQPPWPTAALNRLIIRTASDPRAGPARMPMSGVRFRCSPPNTGMVTRKAAMPTDAHMAATVIFLVDTRSRLRDHIATPIRAAATAHQKITQIGESAPSSRCMCAIYPRQSPISHLIRISRGLITLGPSASVFNNACPCPRSNNVTALSRGHFAMEWIRGA